ncbi:MAG: hypothetical protein QOE29_180 [Gaiellaceae bacterium]|jgi:hypothetical protein|nr:hypothetical protein [Gaiellaceae bacterium]
MADTLANGMVVRFPESANGSSWSSRKTLQPWSRGLVLHGNAIKFPNPVRQDVLARDEPV